MVTGGAGFIGSHLVDAMINNGYEVVIVDNLSTGFKKNINPKAKFFKMDICDKKLTDVFRMERPQIVCHHAAQTVVTRSMSDPVFDAKQNILGSINVLLNCTESNVSKLIYASSGGAVYGEPQYRPVDENHPINPLSPYGISKHVVEHYLQLYGTELGLDYVVLRYANVYGSRQNPKAEAGVVAIFAMQMLGGKQPVIYGSGDKTRDYVHVSDVVAANLLALNKGRQAIYNIGTGIETSDQQMFDTLAHLLRYKGHPQYAPVRKGEISRISLECKNAQSVLGWQPRFSLKDGLAQAINYYRDLC